MTNSPQVISIIQKRDKPHSFPLPPSLFISPSLPPQSITVTRTHQTTHKTRSNSMVPSTRTHPHPTLHLRSRHMEPGMHTRRTPKHARGERPRLPRPRPPLPLWIVLPPLRRGRIGQEERAVGPIERHIGSHWYAIAGGRGVYREC